MTFVAAPEVHTFAVGGPFLPWFATACEPTFDRVKECDFDHPESERMARARAYWLAKSLGFDAVIAKPGATPAAVAGHKDLGPDKWLMDTGCGSDLIGINDVPKFNQEKLMKQCSSEIQLYTANGITTVQNEVLLQVRNLREEVVWIPLHLCLA